MCGIVGYIGKRRAFPEVLVPGLAKLDERGYDSAGAVVFPDGSEPLVMRLVTNGKSPLELMPVHPLAGAMQEARIGMAHTRWATHGSVCESNAHPHADCRGEIFVVHNGIIENAAALRDELSSRGHRFSSETDTEVIVHLIEEALPACADLTEAVKAAIRRLEGTWGLVVMAKGFPDRFVAARFGSPLLLGKGENEMFVASLQDAFLRFTKQMIVLEDGDIVTVTEDGYVGAERTEETAVEDSATDEVEIGEIMRHEILAQPQTVLNALNNGGRLLFDEGMAKLGGLDHRLGELLTSAHLRIVACGTAYHAGLFGKLLLEEHGDFETVEAVIASEARPEVFPKRCAVLGVSQSGETMDTLDVIRRAKAHRHPVFSVVNRVGKAIARETDLGVYTNSGPEKAVASTKVFTAQCVVFVLLTLWYGRHRDVIKAKDGRDICRALMALSGKIASVLGDEEQIRRVAERINGAQNIFYIGRGLAVPVACEGALKLAEVAYVNAQALPAGELKHGRIAAIESGFPVIALFQNDWTLPDMISSANEVKARGAFVIAVAEEGADIPASAVDEVIRVPTTHPWLVPILLNIPLQLFAYHVAKMRGLNPDRPRNLAKSVTVK